MKWLILCVVMASFGAHAAPVYLRCISPAQGKLADLDITVDEAMGTVVQSGYPSMFEDVQFTAAEIRYKFVDRTGVLTTTYSYVIDRATAELKHHFETRTDADGSSFDASAQCEVVKPGARKI